MAKKKTLDTWSIGIGKVLGEQIKNLSKVDLERKLRAQYSISGRVLLAAGQAKDDRVKGAVEKSRRLAEKLAPFKKDVSTLYLRLKAANGKNPTWKRFTSELAATNPETDWEAYDVNGWWKKLNKGEILF